MIKHFETSAATTEWPIIQYNPSKLKICHDCRVGW